MKPRRRNALDYSSILLWMVLVLVLGANAWGQIDALKSQMQAATEKAAADVKAKAAPASVAKDDSASKEELADNVFVPPDRRTLQKLSQAKELLAKGRFGEAVQSLGVILDGPEDYFFQPRQNQPIHRSLKAEARRLIGQMPREGRELYELQFGARARQLLDEAAASGDAQSLAEVSRRFFHTTAGYEATFLLGLHHLDHGRPLAGALILQRLLDCPDAAEQFEPALSLAIATGWLQAGSKDKARDVLLTFRKDHPQMALQTAAGKIPLSSNVKEALDWLTKLVGTVQISEQVESDRWLMFRGNPQRNAITAGSAPLLNLCWRVPATDDPVIEEAIDQTRRFTIEQGMAALPGLHPLVVDDVVLMRTCKNLQAIDFNSGKRLWEVPVDDSLESISSGGDIDANNQISSLSSLISQRIWSDATFGTLSSDGHMVFTIEDIGPPFGMRPTRRVANFSGPISPKSNNRLAAYDIHTGKLKWQLGGKSDDYGVQLPESFFLGPPLPLMGQLYVMAELKGEICLLALDAVSGKLAWSQQLAMFEQGEQQDTMRRMTGISPSYADGILICPTSTGALVAVELATRSLLWGYSYAQPDRANNRYRIDAPIGVPNVDAGVCVADGRVLITPFDSDSLHCLNLLDGELLWKHRRQEQLYSACIFQGNVILVGSHQMQAIRLADGKLGWDGRVISLPERSMPSGRGFFTGELYFLPLDSAEVATVDLVKGRIVHLSKSRKGLVPGNLICYKGRIISQGFDGVDVYYQLDSAMTEIDRKLEANPSDSDALCLQGEIYLDANKRSQAINCFRRAYAIQRDPHSRELLRETLLEGMQNEFAVYGKENLEIEQLLDGPSQQAAYYRLMAVGSRHSGDLPAAMDYCLKLIDIEPDQLPMDTISITLAVRRDRWIQSQFAALSMEAKGDSAEKIDSAIRNRYQTAVSAGSVESLQRFLDYFGNQPIASPVRAEIIRKLIKSRRLLEAEMAILEQNPSFEPAANATALIEVAEMLRDTGKTEPAVMTYGWLSKRLSNTVCRDGKTAKQLLDDLPAADVIRESLDKKESWPKGNVEISSNEKARNNLTNYYGRIPLEFQGTAGPYFADATFSFDQNRRLLLCSDSFGNNLWQLSLTDDHSQRLRYYPNNRGSTQLRALGHLLLITMGNTLFAVDTLRAGENTPPKLLWTQSLGEMAGDLAGIQPMIAQGLFGGMVQLRTMQQMSNQNNDVEPATVGYICVQRSRSLMALDPLTGSAFWVRQDIPQGSVVFGDDEYLFVLPPDKAEAMVLRAMDGELIGSRKISRPEVRIEHLGGPKKSFAALSESCPMIIGRNLLFWRLENERRIMELFDPWTQKSVWPRREFSAAAQYCLVGNELIGVLEPGGEFVLLNLTDGREIANVKLQAESNLSELTVIPSDDRYMVLTNASHSGANQQVRPLQPLFGVVSKPILRGKLYGIDQKGQLMWPEPIEIKDQYLLTNQPSGLPVLVFACQNYEIKQNSQTRQKLSILAVDKRSGRQVYRSPDKIKVSGVLNIEGNAEKKTVNLLMQTQTVTLTFTDNAIPPPGQAVEENKIEKPQGNTSKALLKSLEKTMEQLLNLPKEEILDEEEP